MSWTAFRSTISNIKRKAADLTALFAVLKSKLEKNLSESDRIQRELDEQECRDGRNQAQIDDREIGS